MAYSNFTLGRLRDEFHIVPEAAPSLFAASPPRTVSPWLRETLRRGVPLATAIGTEKAKSEMIVAPVLTEVRELLDGRVSLFSGVDFTVATSKGLNGVCDFIISRSPQQYILEAPVVIIVEAKNSSFEEGLPQCLAAMVAAQTFNGERGVWTEPVFGAITTGTTWKFLRLDGQRALQDPDDHSLSDPGQILGILCSMLEPIGPALPSVAIPA